MKAVQARTRITLKNILFATDFSPAADAAAPIAIADRATLWRKGVWRACESIRRLHELLHPMPGRRWLRQRRRRPRKMPHA